DAMSSKLELDPNVDEEKKKEERQGAEPAADIKESDVSGAAKGETLPDQNLADEKTAQDEEQFDAVEAAVPEDAERVAEMRIEHDEAVRADHHHDGHGPEKIETEDAVGGMGRHRWIERSVLDGKKSRRSRQINIARR